MARRLVRLIVRYFRAYWSIGLFGYFALIALSLEDISPHLISQLFGLVVVLCGAVAWLVNDYVAESDNRVRARLEEISDLLAPYDGMKLSEMPPEVQAEVRKRLGWTSLPSAPNTGTNSGAMTANPGSTPPPGRP